MKDNWSNNCGLRKHLRNIEIYAEESIRRLSHTTEEDAIHIIFECETLASRRNTVMVDDNPGNKINQNKLIVVLLDIIRMISSRPG